MSRTGHEQVVATGSVSVAGRRRVKNDRSMVPPSSRATSGPCGACGARGPPRRHESDTDYLAACPWDSAFGPDLEFFLRRWPGAQGSSVVSLNVHWAHPLGL